MLIAGIAIIAIVGGQLLRMAKRHPDPRALAHRMGAAFLGFTMASAGLFMFGASASAAIVSTIPLGTSATSRFWQAQQSPIPELARSRGALVSGPER